MTDLQTIWFILLGFLLTGYIILDGFDLGVGVLHLFARSEGERRIHINAIGPVWDGNEVWLITAGGALFAAFPRVYATVFSGFYSGFVLLVAALIFRAVSMEFRGKVDSPGWRKLWDWSFGLGSFFTAILFGVVFGTILQGIPLTASGDFTGSFTILFTPYALVTGVFALTLFVMHGALYLRLKTENELAARMVTWAHRCWGANIILFIVSTTGMFFAAPHLFSTASSRPISWIFLIVFLASIIYIPVAIKASRHFRAFISSCAVIASLFGLAVSGLFPRLVPSSIDPAGSLTIYNASSSPKTLMVMLVITLAGMPFVIGYTVFVYRVFTGKVIISESSY